MPSPPSVEVINIGDELLVGIRENAHLTYLGAQLARYGLPVQRAQIATDDPPELASLPFVMHGVQMLLLPAIWGQHRMI